MKNHNIYVNQVGYLVDEDKYFITTLNAESFKLINKNGNSVYSGKVKLYTKKDKSTGETLYRGDFSNYKDTGEYSIILDSGEESFNFNINSSVFNNVLFDSLKSFYFQRCGTDLKEEIVGQFKRGECHNGLVSYHPSTGLTGEKDVRGGWHDAGDYGRYITPASVTLGIMMIGYEQYPDKFAFNHLGLADDTTLTDFLGEIRYELDWMLKMQELDESSKMYGALHYMINSNKYTWDVPDKEYDKQYILDYCSKATADFAAIMAFASRIFRDIDIRFSEIALERSLLAWNFISKNGAYPKDGFQRPTGMVTGGYSEHGVDNLYNEKDMLWPAVELYLTTGDDKYDRVFKKIYSSGYKFTGGMNWMDKSGFPEIQYSMSKVPWIDNNYQKKVRKKFLKRCEKYLKTSLKDGFSMTLKEKEYLWGSNGEVLNRSLQLILAYILTDNDDYKSIALKQFNYILGLNINSMCYVAGIGSNYPKRIHHASFANDGIEECFPGMMTGGANRSVHADRALAEAVKSGTPGAKCYTDNIASYSSNENCITYSAPIVPVSAFFSFMG